MNIKNLMIYHQCIIAVTCGHESGRHNLLEAETLLSLLSLQCLAAGSIIMNREIESMAMRPLAKDLTRSLEEVRNITRDQALRDLNNYTDRMKEALRQFDILFAEFELRYLKTFRFLHPLMMI